MLRRSYRVVSDRGPLGENSGVTGAHLVELGAICKTNEKVHHCVANEYIAERIGSFLGIPIPPGAIVDLGSDDKQMPGYTSLQFGLTGEQLPPIDLDKCVERFPELSAGLVLFDILIANPDRHANNLSAILHEQPYELRVFDHSHALFGHTKNGALKRLGDREERLGITGGSMTKQHRHCLLDKLDDASSFGNWQDRIASIPNHYLETTCRELLDKGLINQSEYSAMIDFLRYRRDHLTKIIQNHRHEFKSITQWGLAI